jgi:hypothetical protein
MYPATFFGLFPAFPRDLRAFVAMSFDHRFNARWDAVLRPALASVQVDRQPLQPHRVDLTMSGDSVLTGILDEISRCRVVVADITSLGVLDGRPARNENVFYEVGLAHAARQPEEVVLFRSDRDPLAFDISNVRVHHYEPDQDPAGARALVSKVVAGSLTELQLRRQLSIRRAAESLDLDAWFVLGEAHSRAGALPPERRTMGQALNAGPRLDAISRLLELTAIRAEFFRVTGEVLNNPRAQEEEPFVRYRATPFGVALFEHVMGMMGMDDPQVQEHFRRLAAEGGPRHVGELS